MTDHASEDGIASTTRPKPAHPGRYKRIQEVEKEIEALESLSSRSAVRWLCDRERNALPETMVFFVRKFLREGQTDLADEVLGELWHRTAPRVVRYLAHHSSANSEDRTDLAHDVMVRLLVAIKSLDPAQEFWEICFWFALKRRMLDAIREFARGKQLAGPANGRRPGTDDMPADPAKPLSGEEIDRIWLLQMLERLPSELKVVVYLHEVEEYTEKEIAEMAGCTERTVRNRLKKGLALLRQMCQAEGLSP